MTSSSRMLLAAALAVLTAAGPATAEETHTRCQIDLAATEGDLQVCELRLGGATEDAEKLRTQVATELASSTVALDAARLQVQNVRRRATWTLGLGAGGVAVVAVGVALVAGGRPAGLGAVLGGGLAVVAGVVVARW